MNHSPAADTAADAAWAPVIAAAYAALTAAVLVFLAAGFDSVQSLLADVGSMLPGTSRIQEPAGIAMLSMAVFITASTILRPRIGQRSEASMLPHLVAISVTALVLAMPPVQWLMFGRPAAAAAHDHHSPAPSEAREEMPKACDPAHANHADGKDACAETKKPDSDDGHDHDH